MAAGGTNANLIDVFDGFHNGNKDTHNTSIIRSPAIFFVFFLAESKKVVILQRKTKQGALAQLARALAWHARGHRFDSVMLH